MNNLPLGVSILFAATTCLTVWLFFTASNKSRPLLIFLLIWMLLQAVIGLSGFYSVKGAFPPRFAFVLGPGLLISVLLFISRRGRRFMDTFLIDKLTILHAIRVPVEITLYFVYTVGLVPLIMTFEGRNLDILSGISAIIIFYIVFRKRKAGDKTLLVWNFLCLGLLINILTIAVLAAETPFQMLAFDQPNRGVTIFPLVWLPTVVVPIVLISHLAAIRQLLRKIKHKNA